jgi:hypothetical protein
MRKGNMKNTLLLAMLTVLTWSRAVVAQPSIDPALEAAFEKITSTHRVFQATLQTKLLDAATGKELMVMASSIAGSKEADRNETDLSQARFAGVSASDMSALKLAGMHRVIQISRHDLKKRWTVYPLVGAWVELPITNDVRAAAAEMKSVAVGTPSRENLDKHPCERLEQSLTTPAGKKVHAIVWRAQDLSNFPIRVELKAGTQMLHAQQSAIRLEAASSSAFAVPSGYQRMRDGNELTAFALKKMGANPKR